ncbi:MAG: hypothetical protein R2699_19540 [Acidimicrobiales bacterium]
MGRSTTYRSRYDFADAPNRIGPDAGRRRPQRELDGNYHLQPATDDPDATDIVYELSIDLMVPIPAPSWRAEPDRPHGARRPARPGRVRRGAPRSPAS